MKRNKKLTLVLGICCGVIFLALMAFFIWGHVEYQMVSLDGYSLTVPQNWTVKTEENTLFFEKDGESVGLFSLIYTDMNTVDIPAYIGFGPEEVQWSEAENLKLPAYTAEFRYDRENYHLCIFSPLPDAPPYQAVLSLKGWNSRFAKAILNSIKLPDLGENAPEKPLQAPDSSFLEQTVCAVSYEDKVFVSNLSTLNRLIRAGAEQPADKASVLHILSYEGDALSKWYYLSVGAGQKKLYTYEKGENGQYYYKNNPILIKNIERRVSADENIIRYLADSWVFLEVPYDHFTEIQNKLYSFKGISLTNPDKANSLVKEALLPGLTLDKVSIDADHAPLGLSLQYTLTDSARYLSGEKPDENVFYRNSLVLFSLIKDADWIETEVLYGEETYRYIYWRKDAEKQLDNQDLCGFTANEKEYEKFLENLTNLSVPNDENSGNACSGVRLLAEKTGSLSRYQTMPHPDTGRSTMAGRYLTSVGLSDYIGSPLTVKLYEKGELGQIVMWLEIADGDLPLGSFSVHSMETGEKIINIVH